MLALNFFIYILICIHNIRFKNLQLKKQPHILIVILFISIITVRFNIINSIHSFISIESQDQYFYYIFIILFSLILYTLVNFLKNCYNINIIQPKSTIQDIKSNRFFVKNGMQNNKLNVVLNPYVIINIVFIILYIIIIYNIFIVEFFQLNYSIKTNIKSMYLNILFIGSISIFVKSNTFIKKYYFICFISLLFISYFDSIIILVVINLFFISILSRKPILKKHILYLIHIIFIIMLMFTFHQTYNFTGTKYNNYIDTGILKINNFIKLKTVFSDRNLQNGYYGNFFSKISLFDKNTFLDKNINGFFKNIFEKGLFIKNGIILELYNYNMQFLIQGFIFSVFVLLLLICFYLYKFLKKNYLIVM